MSTNGKHAPAAGPHASTGLYVKSRNGRKLRDLTVYRLIRKMRIAMPWIEDSDEPACRAWAQLEVMASKAYAELRDHGLLGAGGEPRRLLSEFKGLRSTQLSYERELGMTPASRMALKATGMRVPVDLAARMANDDESNDEVNDDG